LKRREKKEKKEKKGKKRSIKKKDQQKKRIEKKRSENGSVTERIDSMDMGFSGLCHGQKIMHRESALVQIF